MSIEDKEQRSSKIERAHDDPVFDLAKERLGEVLVRIDMITPEQLRAALDIARRDGKLVGQVLVEKGLVTARDLATAVSVHLGVPLVDLKKHRILPEALKLVPEQLARKYNVLPLDIIGGALALVMENPMDVRGIDDIAAVSKMRVEPMMGFADDIRSAIDRNYTVRGRMAEDVSTSSEVDVKEEVEREEAILAEVEAPALRNLNLVIQQAVRQRASDIHIEPQEDKLQIRYRIDGVLYDTATLTLSIHAALISRLKIMGGMNIAERRRPQDGRFSAKVDDVDIDVRVACANTVHGEMAVLRLLSKSGPMLDLAGLGFLPSALERYKRMIDLPFGMIILGGPTGSGKTTTLYASLNLLDRMGRNIMTIEDPVEYNFPGINQFQVNPKAGVDFAGSLRAFMRLDPDVIMVGEIRDSETARVATQAAITGHIVFSSVHANDAVSVILRLVDLGIEPFFVCSALTAACSQRIVRRICPQCRQVYEPTAEEQAAYMAAMGEPAPKLYKGMGCNLCSDTGYMGRIGIFELLILTEEIKKLAIMQASAEQIRIQAIKDGMVSLMSDGMAKAKEGLTTISEVLRQVFY